jgi:hypothetical protein
MEGWRVGRMEGRKVGRLKKTANLANLPTFQILTKEC